MESLFRAFFMQGRDIGDAGVLGDIAAENAMDRSRIVARLESDEDRDMVADEIARAQAIGVTGVPTFVLEGRYALVGAQPPADIARALQDLAAGSLQT